jgi:SET and MYND domain-containing protein
MYDTELNSKADGCFPFTSLINHSCVPNCIVLFNDNKLILKSIENILENEELFISYCDPILITEDRQTFLRDHYYFKCICKKCLDVFKGNHTTMDQDSLNITLKNIYSKCLNNDNYSQTLRQEFLNNLPDWAFDLDRFKLLTKQLQINTESCNWKKASILAINSMSMYWISYPLYHPLTCLQAFLAAKCLWNCNNISESDWFLNLALKIFDVAYGLHFKFDAIKSEMDNLKLLIDDKLGIHIVTKVNC